MKDEEFTCPKLMPDMLINDIAKMFDDCIRKKAHGNDGYEQFGGTGGASSRHILFHLAKQEKPITQLSLAAMTHLTAPTISVALRSMESRGFITRTRNPEDMRETLVGLTQKGRDFNDFLRRSLRETQSEMLRGLTDEENEQLVVLLKKIRGNMEEML